jgi:hypothetical protein
LAAILLLAEGSCVPGLGASGATFEQAGLEPQTQLGGLSAGGAAQGPDPATRAAAAMMCATLMFGVLFLLLTAALRPGYLRLQRSLLEGEGISFRALWAGRSLFLRMLGWKVLAGIIRYGLPVLVLFIIGQLAQQADTEAVAVRLAFVALTLVAGSGVLFVILGLALGDWLVALRGAGPLEALRGSWRLAQGRRLKLLAFIVATWVVTLAGLVGLVLFVVGAVVTVPLSRVWADLMLTDAVAQVLPELEQAPSADGRAANPVA